MGEDRYVKFRNDCLKGIKRPIKSRKKGIFIGPKRFSEIRDKYFKNLSEDSRIKINPEHDDLVELLFMMRCYYRLWLEIEQTNIIIFREYPKECVLTEEVNKLNHPHSPKTFKKGTLMYYSEPAYGVCDWSKGFPLWTTPNHEDSIEKFRFCQINYNYIKPTI